MISAQTSDVELAKGAVAESAECPGADADEADEFDVARCIASNFYGMPAEALPDEYVNQFAFVQNPVANPGFSLPVVESGGEGVANWHLIRMNPSDEPTTEMVDGHIEVTDGYLKQLFDDYQGDSLFRGLSGVSLEAYNSPVHIGVELIAPDDDGAGEIIRVCWTIQPGDSGFKSIGDRVTDGPTQCQEDTPNSRAPTESQEDFSNYPLHAVQVSGADGFGVDNVVLDGVAYGPQTLVRFIDGSVDAEAHVEFDDRAGAAGEDHVEWQDVFDGMAGYDLFFHDGFTMIIVPTGFHHDGSVDLWAGALEFTPSGPAFADLSLGNFWFYDETLLSDVENGRLPVGSPDEVTSGSVAESGSLGPQMAAYFGSLGLDPEAQGIMASTSELPEDGFIAAVGDLANSRYAEVDSDSNRDVGGFFNIEKALDPLAIANDQLDVIPTPVAPFAAAGTDTPTDLDDGWAMHIEPTSGTPTPQPVHDDAVCLITSDDDGCHRDQSVFVPAEDGKYNFWVFANDISGQAHVDPADDNLFPRETDKKVVFGDGSNAVLEFYDLTSFQDYDPMEPGKSLVPLFRCELAQQDGCEVSGSRVTVDADRIQHVGPVSAWAWIDVGEEVDDDGIHPASGYFSLLKNSMEGQAITDALDYAFTPMVLTPEEPPSVGDGFFVKITPFNALRTDLGAMMESNVRGNYVFEVCAFNGDGSPYEIFDYRLEMLGIQEDEGAPAGAGVVYATGSYTSGGQTLDRELKPADGDGCVFVDVPRFEVGGDKAYDQAYHVSFFVPFESTGKNGFYSEAINGLFDADGDISQDSAFVADTIDGTARSGVLLVPRNGSPATQDLTVGTLLGGAL